MSFYHERLESKMQNLISVKYDITRPELLFAQSLQSICIEYVDKQNVNLLVTVSLSYNLIYDSKHGNH